MLSDLPGLAGTNRKFRWKRWLIAGLAALGLVISGFAWLAKGSPETREAPEADQVLNAQASLPFQVLIPAYLPRAFRREQVEIKTDLAGPMGEPRIQIVYPAAKGISLTLTEWVPSVQGDPQVAAKVRRCICTCRANRQCNMTGMELLVGDLRVQVEFSPPNIFSYNQLQFVLSTLGPAANSQVYTSINEVPLSISLPPAVDVPLNGEGVQEVTLVVSPEGYDPVHFAVQKGKPVRLIFRQLGQVGCGNELIFQWGNRQSDTIVLQTPDDKEILEFTPEEAGEFQFHCPHWIFRGLMTVKD
jgi:hypothetical protein